MAAPTFDWNDLRYLLAVFEEGSTLAAARKLKVDQTTVARRVAALEQAMGLTLVERRQSGYLPTEDGIAVLDYAVRMNSVATDLAAQMEQRRRGISGTVRVTMSESVANLYVVPALGRFYEEYPDVRIEIMVEDRRLDLLKGEADIALRSGTIPNDAGLVVRKLQVADWYLYASSAYIARCGMPETIAELCERPVVLCEGSVSQMPAMAWLKETARDAPVGATSSSLTNVVAAVRAGLGIGPLPQLIGDHYEDLHRCLGAIPGSRYDFFMLVRESMRNARRIRAFMDFFATEFGKHCGPVR